MIYLGTSRTDRSDFGSVFDRGQPALHVERRTISTVAAQALYLMNRSLDRRGGTAGAAAEIAAEPEAARRIRASHWSRRVADRSTELDLGCGSATGTTEHSPWEPARQFDDPWAVYTQALLSSNEFMFVD